MAEEKAGGRPVDATGDAVRTNIRRVRDGKGVSAPELSQRLAALDRPIPPLGISRIENGQRRVDVDDLMAIAVALEVSPLTLLMPNTDDRFAIVTATAVTGDYSAEDLWKWLRADNPLKRPYTGLELLDFVGDATPTWRAREYGEGVLKLIELDQIQDAIREGGEGAAAAELRLKEFRKENRLGSDGDD